jgi:hypothetical protein
MCTLTCADEITPVDLRMWLQIHARNLSNLTWPNSEILLYFRAVSLSFRAVFLGDALVF